MKNKKYLILLSAVLTVLVILPFLRFGTATAQENQPVFSPAINVLSGEIHFAKSAVSGAAITFSPEDFDLAFGMQDLPAITVLSLPPKNDGDLKLGELPVTLHQTISRADLSMLTFLPRSSSIATTSFMLCNSGNDQTYNITCELNFSSQNNKAPTLSEEDKLYLTQTTLANIAITDRLRAKDPEGEPCTFVVTKYPEKGVFTLINAVTGQYSYIPRKDTLGQDIISYYAIDNHGLRSEEYTVSVSVQASESGILYTDLIEHRAHMSAIRLTQQGIMSGNDVGGFYVFRPEEKINKSEFLVMAMKSINYPILSCNEELPFTDKDEVSNVYSDYIYTAWKANIIEPEATESGTYLHPNATITKAEAAVIVQKLIQASVPVDAPAFADTESIPTWAKSALQTLYSLGMIDTDVFGNIFAEEAMTRADSAELIYKLSQYSNK